MAEDDEWEESMVVMELNGIIDSDWISKCGDTWKIVGIETETPLLQIDHYVFTGKYEDTVGTNVLFQVDKIKPETERHMLDKHKSMDEEPNRLSYSTHTFKQLHMQRSFLTERERPGMYPAGLVPNEDTHSRVSTTIPPKGAASTPSEAVTTTPTATAMDLDPSSVLVADMEPNEPIHDQPLTQNPQQGQQLTADSSAEVT